MIPALEGLPLWAKVASAIIAVRLCRGDCPVGKEPNLKMVREL